MVDSNVLTDLVRQAQTGDSEGMNRLSELARGRLCVFVQRMTLDHNLTQDIVQESMLEMFRFLSKLEKADSFWPWLRKIALNKLRHHYKRQSSRRCVLMPEMEHLPDNKDARQGFAEVAARELKQIVLETMSEMKPRYREVLVLRCYEQMEYAQIAGQIGCSEFATRVLFFRAKNSLAKQLSRRGLGRGALLGALILFGKLTAPSEAAASVTITSATVKVGLVAAAAAVATGKAVVTVVATAGVITAGSVFVVKNMPPAGPGGSTFTSVPISSSTTTNPSTAGQAVSTRPVNEQWYFYPDGPTGPVMTRKTVFLDKAGHSFGRWLQNDEANYYYDSRSNTVTKNNHHTWNEDLTVWTLPTDSPALSEFLSKVQPNLAVIQRVDSSESGLLVIARQNDPGQPWSMQHLNALEEDYFRGDWPIDFRMIDKRDVLHERGWAHMRISGDINGQTVRGFGRVPLVYKACQDHKPVLRMQIGERVLVSDTPRGTYLYETSEKVLKTYRRQRFFAGLCQPWMGLHAIDTVRRDAAACQVQFSTSLSDDGKIGRVTLDRLNAKIVYTIEMEQDLVTRIEFYRDDGAGDVKRGQIVFTYMEEFDTESRGFVKPRQSRRIRSESTGMLWLFDLIGGG